MRVWINLENKKKNKKIVQKSFSKKKSIKTINLNRPRILFRNIQFL